MGDLPIVISHRGASGHRPEHTLESYRLAIAQGADYVEPDLVATKDGVLVARHENEISGTTDVADRAEFAQRKTTKVIDGVAESGWFTEDFTLAELKTLRARERLPRLRPGNTAYDGLLPVPTLQEIIDLVRRESRRLGRPIGIYPETKRPMYFASIGLPLEEPLVRTLRRNGLAHHDAPVFIQSFESWNLRKLYRMIDVPLIQLMEDDHLTSPAGLRWISTYAAGIGPAKSLVADTPLVRDAHAAGLLVHVWTLRNENAFLPPGLRRGADPAAHGDAAAEYDLFFGLGVDGVFSDFPDTAVAARAAVVEVAA